MAAPAPRVREAGGPSAAEPAANRLCIDATLASREPLRYTPAGIPALDCTLRHASQQPEAGTMRRVECELFAVAFAEVARALAGVAPGRTVRCEGFLARRWRTGVSVALHVTRFTELD